MACCLSPWKSKLFCIGYHIVGTSNMKPAPTLCHLWQGQLCWQLLLPHWARKEMENVGSSYLEGKGRVAYISVSPLPTTAMAFLSWPWSSEQRIITLLSHLRCLKLRCGAQQDSSKEEYWKYWFLYFILIYTRTWIDQQFLVQKHLWHQQLIVMPRAAMRRNLSL